MDALIETYWPLLLAALAIGLLVAWFVFHANRKTTIKGSGGDVLDEGAAPAARNQALIDSAPAASKPKVVPPATPVSLAGAGEAVSGASEDAQAATPEPAPAPAPAPAETPVPTPTPAPASTSTAATDDLTRIKGLGPKLSATLADLGVTSFSQIANWDDAEIDRIDAQLGRFQGRIRRDDWVGQANLLAAGDDAGFARLYGQTG